MKTTSLLALVAAVTLAATQAAAVPDLVTYAARVENDAGPFSGTASVTFQLFAETTGGSELWSENAASVVVIGGDLVHELGSIEPLDDALFDADDIFLQVTINGDTLEPRTAIRAVPFALRAKEADVADVATSALSADNATRLGGQPVSAFQFSVVANGGLVVADNQFSIADAGVTSARIATGAVGTAQLAPNAVTGGVIADGAVGTNDLANGAVSGGKLADAAVSAAKLAAASVASAALQDGAVSSTKLASASVTAGKIASNAVTAGNLAGNVVRVVERPAGCGGGLQGITTQTSGSRGPGCVGGLGLTCTAQVPCTCATCQTQVCGISSDVLRFASCDGGSCTQFAPATCTLGSFPNSNVGSLTFAP